ncbi:hypothetical protein JHY03_54860 [Streptomyces sp. CA-256286]|nr:hypothetical protein JHY03_54860 [Streptomyces sp. CA-256286]
MVQKPESDIEPKERRIDLSLPQVAGSAVAAVAAAVAASQLGVYGTIAGAGVMSVVATCGGSVFQHFFRRTGEQIREVTVQVTHPEGRQVTVHTKETTPAGHRGAERRTDPEQAPVDDATTVLPTVDPGAVPEVVPDAESTRQLRPADPDRTQLLDLGDARTRMLRAQPGAGGGSDPDRTRLLPRAPSGAAVTGGRPTGDGFTEGTTQGTRLRGWKRPALAAAAVFAVSMAGITAFEMISGNDLSGGQGTTLSSVVRGGADRDQGPADPTPSGTPAGTAATSSRTRATATARLPRPTRATAPPRARTPVRARAVRTRPPGPPPRRRLPTPAAGPRPPRRRPPRPPATAAPAHPTRPAPAPAAPPGRGNRPRPPTAPAPSDRRTAGRASAPSTEDVEGADGLPGAHSPRTRRR